MTDAPENMPETLLIRDTKLHDDLGGMGQRIYTTAGAGYKKTQYTRTDIAPKVKPLVWEGVEDDCFVTCEALGFSYELCVSDTLERPCDYVWDATAKPDNSVRWANANNLVIPAQASFAEAKAAAQAHHNALIRSALVTPAGDQT